MELRSFAVLMFLIGFLANVAGDILRSDDIKAIQGEVKELQVRQTEQEIRQTKRRAPEGCQCDPCECFRQPVPVMPKPKEDREG